MHRTLPVLAALTALALPAAASAANDPTVPTPVKVQAVVGANNDTTCIVDADLYKPAGASAEHPVAAILTTNGFGGSKASQASLAKAYVTRGYGVLSYSGLGFGASGCKITLDDPDTDGKAASAMIDYLGGGRADTDGHTVDWVIRDIDNHAGGQSPHDPRVGMIGGSYGGQIQFAAADVDPRLDTIIPQITWNDLSYSLAPNNTAFKFGVTSTEPGTEKFEWNSLFFGLGIGDGVQETLQNQDSSHLGQCPNYDDRVCQAKAQMDATGYPSQDGIDLTRHASVSSYMSKIRIPTFLAQGQSDTLFNLNEAAATFAALQDQGTPVKMLWKSDGHSGSPLGSAEDNAANPEAAYASREYLEWMDYYLRGIGDPPQLDVSFYRDWVKTDKDAAPAIVTAPGYPVAKDRTYYLSGDNALVGDPSAVKAGASPASFSFAPGAPTSYTETSALDQSQPPSDPEGGYVKFDSPVLLDDTDVAGIPTLKLSLSAPAQEQGQQADPGGRLVIFAKLFELDADGKTLVLPHRLIAPVRVPDVTKPFTVTLPGIVHRFPKGSKFELRIAASDAAYKNNNEPGQVTVNIDPKSPLALTIPILGPNDTPSATGSTPQTPGAGQLPQVRREGQQNKAASLPAAKKRCRKNRRVITIHFTGVKKPDRIISRKVTLNGKRLKLRRKAKVLRISFKKRKAGTYRVFVLVKSKKGKVRRTARTYRVC